MRKTYLVTYGICDDERRDSYERLRNALMAAIFYGPVIRAPALPSVLVVNTTASTDGKAEARIKKSRQFLIHLTSDLIAEFLNDAELSE